MSIRRHPVAVTRGLEAPLEIPLDLALIARLRASFARVRAHGDRFGAIFYERLFEAAPELRPLFRTERDAQVRKLVATLDAVVAGLEHPKQTAADIAALGRRHATYGARPEHYGLVVRLLTQSMREVLGDEADPDDLEAWRTTLELVSAQMIAS